MPEYASSRARSSRKKRTKLVNQHLPGTAQPDGQGFPDELGFLFVEHPIYTANKDQWQQNEELLYGGHLGTAYLRPFEWELEKMHEPESAFSWRQEQAVYPNLPDKFTTLITNHLLRSAPRPDQGLSFGKMGKVGDPKSEASLIYYSCDHPGQRGTTWDAWWQQTMKHAMATGHRWIMVNGPPETPKSKLEERFGKKPYLVEFSPLQVPNWYFNPSGDLEFVVVDVDDANPRVERGAYVVEGEGRSAWKLLLVKEGVTRLGAQFQGGGWWLFQPDGVKFDSATFDDTDGDIPFFPYFSEPHKGVKGHPAMSRPSTTELGKCAISLMNLSSAANFDAWDSAMGIEWLRGVDLEAWNLAMEKQKEGSRWLPLPPNSETDDVPEVTASKSGSTASESHTAREQSLWNQAQWLGIQESAGNAGTMTAVGSNADFSASQMPRIMQLAMQTMSAQNMAIYFLELRFGHTEPEGQAIWPTRFNLVELTDRVKAFFEAERLAGIRATTLDAEAMVQLAVEKGLVVTEADRATYLAEYIANGELRDKAVENGMNEPGDSQDPKTADDQAERIRDKKDTDPNRTRKPGRPSADK